MRILFEHKPSSYLPEVNAYKDYLRRYDFVKTADTTSNPDAKPADFDVYWRFMGLAPYREAGTVVQEYNSISTAPFAQIKNLLKKKLNHRPEFRVFLSERVKQEFNFADGVPSGIRNMGISRLFYQQESIPDKFDYHLVYIGTLTKNRKLAPILEHISNEKHGLKTLLIGEPSSEIFDKFKSSTRITFAGRVDQKEIPALTKTAFAGLNYTPDIYPYNVQTSTKLIEYCALGLNIVSNKYEWATNFEKHRNAKFFWLENSYDNLNACSLEDFAYKTPDVADLEWNQVIKRSQIFENFFENHRSAELSSANTSNFASKQ